MDGVSACTIQLVHNLLPCTRADDAVLLDLIDEPLDCVDQALVLRLQVMPIEVRYACQLRTCRPGLHLGRSVLEWRVVEIEVEISVLLRVVRSVPFHHLVPFGAFAQTFDEMRVLMATLIETAANRLGVVSMALPRVPLRVLHLRDLLHDVVVPPLGAQVHLSTVLQFLSVCIKARQCSQSSYLVLKHGMGQNGITIHNTSLLLIANGRLLSPSRLRLLNLLVSLPVGFEGQRSQFRQESSVLLR